MAEARGNWEDRPIQTADGRTSLWWPKVPSERACRFCRRNLMHTRAEHDLVYPADREAQLAHERAEEQRQVEADNGILRALIADGATEEEAIDYLWQMAGAGEGLVEPNPRPMP